MILSFLSLSDCFVVVCFFLFVSILSGCFFVFVFVFSYAIFIASELQALPLTRALPLGHGHVVTDTAMLPRIFKGIFQQALTNTDRVSKL